MATPPDAEYIARLETDVPANLRRGMSLIYARCIGGRVTTRAVVLLIAVALAVATPMATADEKRHAERPTYSVGDRWALKDGVYDLIKVERDAYIFAAGAGRRIYLTKNIEISSILRDRAIEWEIYPMPGLAWPLEVGKWGLGSGVLRNRDHPSGVRVRVSWRVTGYETVKVIAGSFEAFRIAYEITVDLEGMITGRGGGVSIPGRKAWSIVAWYAPQARRIVKSEAVGVDSLNLEVVAVEGAPVIADVPARPPGPPAGPATPPASAQPGGLQVVISVPTEQAQVDYERLVVAGYVAGGQSPRQVLVALNGAEVSRVPDRQGQPTLPLNVSVQLREGPNTLVVTATDAAGTTQQTTRTILYERQVPLTVQVRHPDDRARVSEPESTVAASVTSSRGVVEVGVTLNGAKVFEERQNPPKKSVAVVTPVKLRPGSNVVVVRALEPDGTARQEVRSVIYEPRPSASPPPELKPTETADRWAVVIGVGQYENPQVPALRYAAADAEAVAAVLVERGGFTKDNVLLLTDKTGKKPTLRNIKWALGTFLARSAKKNDLVVVYFAGHGAPEVDPRGIEPDGLTKYLVPIDADPNDLYATGLPMDEFQPIFERIEADRVVVFLDSCYSGAAGGRTFASQRTRAGKVDDVFIDRLTRSHGRVIITASRSSEVSLELPELGHGLFTYYLVQGLRGTADLDRDGVVSLQELYVYLQQQVSQKSRVVGGNQHPVMWGWIDGPLTLVNLGHR
jgi:uncharacterized caspase-like protein